MRLAAVRLRIAAIKIETEFPCHILRETHIRSAQAVFVSTVLVFHMASVTIVIATQLQVENAVVPCRIRIPSSLDS